MSFDFDNTRLENCFLTEEHREWQALLRRFFDKEVRPHADQWDEQGYIPDELWSKARARA